MLTPHVPLPAAAPAVDRARWFVFEHFERILVVFLVASLVAIHWFVDLKVAFLSFYYLPVIVAGFRLGRSGAVFSAVLIVALTAFLQAVAGFGGGEGFELETVLTLLPWAGFLILTGYAVGTLADQRKHHAEDMTQAYVSILELLTFHLESSERGTRGHASRVAEQAVTLGRELGMRTQELEQLRVAALLHELNPHDPRMLRLFEQFPGDMRGLPIAASMQGAFDIVRHYGSYHAHLGAEFPVDALRIPLTVKVLAVADAYETLQTPNANRPAFSTWAALEEIERGAGTTFGTEVVRALRRVAGIPVTQEDSAAAGLLKLVALR